MMKMIIIFTVDREKYNQRYPDRLSTLPLNSMEGEEAKYGEYCQIVLKMLTELVYVCTAV